MPIHPIRVVATLAVASWLIVAHAQEPRTLVVEEAPKNPSPAILQTVTPGKRWALLVGVAKYPQTSESFDIPPLKSPTKDVEALANFLRDPNKGGFSPENVKVLTDENAKQRDILIALNEIAQKAAPEDMVLVYFSGHGYKPPDENETTYLIPYDVDMRDLDATAINFNRLSDRITKMEARKVVVILDACHSGGVKPKGARSVGTTGLVRRYLEAFEKSEGRALLLSSDESEVSWEEDAGGVFTSFLLRGLNGEADVNRDGLVTFTEAALYVEKAVPDYTRERFPKVQKPVRRYEFGPIRGDIPLAVTPAFEERTKAERELHDLRRAAVDAASLPADLRELCLQTVDSALERTLLGGVLTPKEERILSAVDALRLKQKTPAEVVESLRALLQPTEPSAPVPPKPPESLPPTLAFVVSVSPPDADVALSAANRGFQRESQADATHTFRLQPGRYTVTASRKGYKTVRRDVDVRTDGQRLDVALELAFGTLEVDVTPSDATLDVVVNSLDADPLPDEVALEQDAQIARLRLRRTNRVSLATGTYTVTASKKGYKSQERQVSVTEGKTSTLLFRLTREGQSTTPDEHDLRDASLAPSYSPKWVEAVGEAYLQTKTGEEAQQIALMNAYKNAVKQAVGEVVDVTETRIVAESNEAFQKAFTEVSRIDTRGIVVRAERPTWEALSVPNPPGPPILGYRVTVRCLVQPDTRPEDPAFRLNVALNRVSFQVGEECILRATATRSSFVTLFNITSEGRVRLLIPSKELAEVRLPAGVETEIPPLSVRQQGVRLRVRLPEGRSSATESFLLVATKDRVPPPKTVDGVSLPLLEMNQWLASIPKDQRAEDVVAFDIRKETF